MRQSACYLVFNKIKCYYEYKGLDTISIRIGEEELYGFIRIALVICALINMVIVNIESACSALFTLILTFGSDIIEKHKDRQHRCDGISAECSVSQFRETFLQQGFS